MKILLSITFLLCALPVLAQTTDSASSAAPVPAEANAERDQASAASKKRLAQLHRERRKLSRQIAAELHKLPVQDRPLIAKRHSRVGKAVRSPMQTRPLRSARRHAYLHRHMTSWRRDWF